MTFLSDVAVQLAIGTIVIVLVAYHRFGTPAELRSQTTALRYHSAAAAYSMMALFLYYLIALAPLLSLKVAKVFFGLQLPDGMIEMVDKLPPAAFALLLILAIPQLPKVSALDGRVRKYFQRLADIPFQAQWLSARLAEAAFHLDDRWSERVHETLRGRSFKPEDLAPESKIKSYWIDISGLCLRMQSWAADDDYRSFVARFPALVDNIVAAWEREIPAARDALRRRRMLAELRKDLDGKVQDADFRARIRREMEAVLRDYDAVLTRSLDELREKLCDVASRAILTSFQTQKSRSAAIANLGFQMKRPIGFGIDQLIFTTALVFATICGIILLGQELLPFRGDRPPIVVLAGVATLTHLIAVVFAVLSQRPESIRPRASLHRRPYGHYLWIGLLAAVLASPLPVAFFFLLRKFGALNGQIEFHMLIAFMPIAFLASGSAAITAFNIDNGVGERPRWAGPVPIERLREGLGQGVAQGIWFWFLMTMIVQPLVDRVGPAGMFPSPSGAEQPEIFGVRALPLLIEFSVGFIIGCLVPGMYREAYSEMRNEGPPSDHERPAVVPVAIGHAD